MRIVIDIPEPPYSCVMCGRVNPPCGWSTVTFGLPGFRCHDCIDRYYGRDRIAAPAADPVVEAD